MFDLARGDELHLLRVQRAQRAQVLQRLAVELAGALVRGVEDVGGDERALDVLAAEQLRIRDRRAGGLGGRRELLAADRHLVRDELREHPAERIVRAARAAGGDAEEHAVLRERAGGEREAGRERDGRGTQSMRHGFLLSD